MKRVTMVINGETIKIENVEEVTVTEITPCYRICSKESLSSQIPKEAIHAQCPDDLLTTEYIKELLNQHTIISIEKI